MTQRRLLGGRYELDGVVGRGGMAEVYRARDLRLDRIVAVKTLREDLARDQTFQARFRREAQSAASLNHPSIVAVYDTGDDNAGPGHIPFIVMEYVDGRTIRDLLRDDRRLLPERALEITDGVLRALDYSHRNGIVHRDIKPGNVMLNRSGEIKVMDFGIARAVSDAQATMTQTAQVIGTAQYLSPEQARGERVDARSDLYSVGCLLYELLTGRPPFTGDSPVAIAYQHVRENPIPPSRVDPELPGWADAITLKAMEKDPADRYQSGSDMRDDIQRAMSGFPVAAQIQPASYGGGPGTRRLDPMGQTQLQGQTGSLPPYAYGPDDGGAPRGPGRKRRAIWPWVTALVALIVIGAAIGTYELINTTGSGTAVPEVTGKKLAVAEQLIAAAGFIATPVSQVSATAAPNVVSSTSPAGGLLEPKGTHIKLFYNVRPGTKKLPDVSKLSLSAAEQELKAMGWTNVSEAPPPLVATLKVPSGEVVRTVPTAGAKVPAGNSILLYVSGGGVKVPYVNYLSESAAKNALGNAGLTAAVVTAPGPPGAQPRTVWQTKPGPSKVVLPQSTVTIYVVPAASTTPTPTPTPTPTVTPTPTGSPSTPARRNRGPSAP